MCKCKVVVVFNSFIFSHFELSVLKTGICVSIGMDTETQITAATCKACYLSLLHFIPSEDKISMLLPKSAVTE